VVAPHVKATPIPKNSKPETKSLWLLIFTWHPLDEVLKFRADVRRRVPERHAGRPGNSRPTVHVVLLMIDTDADRTFF
jgi:hypothetical protein